MGGGGGQQQRQQQPRQQEQPRKKKQDDYGQADPSGVMPLGKRKFPDTRSNHAWLVLFFDADHSDDPSEKGPTGRYITMAKQISEKQLMKTKGKVDLVMYKVGAVDCAGGSEATQFCITQLGEHAEIPSFATVINGSVNPVSDARALRSAKTLHEHAKKALASTDGLVINVNAKAHIQQRLLSSSPSRPGRPAVAILLFTDKYETSPLYASLAYRHRGDGFAGFGESRGKNIVLGREYKVKKYPTLVAIVGDVGKVETYNGNGFEAADLTKWINKLEQKHFGTSKGEKGEKKHSSRR